MQPCPRLCFKQGPSKTAGVCSVRRASPAAPEPPGNLGLLGLSNTWHRCHQQRVPPCARAIANVPGLGGGKIPLLGGARTHRVLGDPEERSCQHHLLPTDVAAAPGTAGGPSGCKADAMIAEGRPVLPTPPECRHQPRGRRWPRVAPPNPCAFSFGFHGQAPVQTQPATHLSWPVQSCSSIVPPCCCLRRHLQKPSLLFIKLLKNKAFTPWPQDTPVKAEPWPAHMVLLSHTSERRADLHEGPFVCGYCQWQK